MRLGIADLVAADEVPRVAPELARLRCSELTVNEWRFRRKDGSLLHGEVSARQLPDGRLQAFLRDISDRKRDEAELKDERDACGPFLRPQTTPSSPSTKTGSCSRSTPPPCACSATRRASWLVETSACSCPSPTAANMIATSRVIWRRARPRSSELAVRSRRSARMGQYFRPSLPLARLHVRGLACSLGWCATSPSASAPRNVNSS